MADLSLFDLTGRKALVTGGSMGIGRGYAIALAKAGADVAIVDINQTCGEKTAQEIKDLGRDSFFVRCDVTDKASVDRMVADVVSRFGRLDIAVNNAGTIRRVPDETASKQDWDVVLSVNLSGVYFCAQAEARQMIRQDPQGGKIINTGSTSGSIANANGPYAASKAGVIHLSRMLAAEWSQYNIYVNCISPSWTWSTFHASAPVAARDRLRTLHPVGWIERPEDLYGPIVFLASKASNYVTGHNLTVDGGFTLNIWLTPVPRVAPALVSRQEEVTQLIHDLDMMGVPHDEEGFAPSLHPDETQDLQAIFNLR